MNNQIEKNQMQFRNFAFISYSRKDINFASWFQKNLESYHLPSKLVKEHSELPKRLSPIFRDQTNLVGIVLEEALMRALDDSKYLIVVCSPNSAHSKYVNLEIEYFKSIGMGKNIIPLILDGVPFSDDPEKECFPEAIKSITPELLGISVEEHGKHNAMIRTVATMLSLSPDDLIRREEKRRRIRSISIGACSAILAVIAGFALYYNIPHSKYYNAYTTVNEIPVGIYELSRQERKQAYDCYKITTLRGKVVSLETVNSDGYVFEPFIENTFDDYPCIKYTEHDENNRPTVIEAYNATNKRVLKKELKYNDEKNTSTVRFYTSGDNERPLSLSADISDRVIEDNSESSNKSEITHQINTYYENGYVKTTMYYKGEFSNSACDSNGVYGKAFEYNDLGLVETVMNLDEDGDVHNCKYGWAIQKYEYDKTGTVVKHAYYSDKDVLTVGEAGIPCEIAIVDGVGNYVSVHAFSDAEGEIPTNNKSGCSLVTYSYKNGRLESIKSYDTNEKPVIHKDVGYHEIRCEYDGKGNCTKYSYYDTDGNPTAYKDTGACIEMAEYDDYGNPIEIRYYNAQNELIINNRSFAVMKRSYKNGNIVSEKYFGINGEEEPIIHKYFGYHELRLEYDERGNRIKSSYYDTEDNLTAHKDTGACIETLEYDDYGNWTEARFLNSEKALTMSNDGYAIMKLRYENGNLVSESYFGVNEAPIIHKDSGFHEIRWEYDGKGNRTKYSYYDIYGNSTVYKETGACIQEVRYDDYGNLIEKRYFNSEGTLVMSNYGYAIMKLRYENGNLVSESYFGINEEQIIPVDLSYHEICTEYDTEGNVVKLEYYDTEGNPVKAE